MYINHIHDANATSDPEEPFVSACLGHEQANDQTRKKLNGEVCVQQKSGIARAIVVYCCSRWVKQVEKGNI